MSSLLNKFNKFHIRVQPCKYGRGVFAEKDFKKGELIEVCPVLVLTEHDSHLLWAAHGSILEKYYFDYDQKHFALALGYGSLYNHAESENAGYTANTDNAEIAIYALKKIKKGGQIFINYGYNPVTRFKK